MSDEIPASLLKYHPELVIIQQALTEFHTGKAITTCCPTCGELLVIQEIPTISRTVLCPISSRHLNYRERLS